MIDEVRAGPPQPDAEPPDLLLEAERLIGELDTRHGPDVREKTARLLAAIDAIHRAGLTHLMDVVRGMGGAAFVNRLIADPAIRMLLMSYDLVPVDRRLMAEEALDSVRGHLHSHGVDVEILEVVGGVVYTRLHGVAAANLTEAAVVRDLEEALRAGFVGFQELVTRERHAAASAVPIGLLRRPHRPVYRDVFAASQLPDGGKQGIDLDGQPILVARHGSDYYAVTNRCGDSPLPLEFSELTGTEIRCSWHGCRYDVRTGHRLDRPGAGLAVYPVSVADGDVQVAVAVTPVGEPM